MSFKFTAVDAVDVDVERLRCPSRFESSKKDEDDDDTVDNSESPTVVVRGTVTTTADEAYHNTLELPSDVVLPLWGICLVDLALGLLFTHEEYRDANADSDRTVVADEDKPCWDSDGSELSAR